MVEIRTIKVGLLALLLGGCLEQRPLNAPLWTVEHGGHQSYVLGTMHDGIDAEELPSVVWTALAESAALVTEADVRGLGDAAFRDAVTLGPFQSVRASMQPDDWLALVEALAAQYTAHNLDTLQPWFLASELQRTWLPDVHQMEAALVEEAVGSGVELVFLETWREQITLLNDLGMQDGTAVLTALVRDQDGARRQLRAWLEAYRRGDVDALEAMSLTPAFVEARPAYYDDIVFGRTDAWLPSLELQLTRGPTVIAVGFMHVLGPRGLVALLETKGYAVERWSPEGL